MSNSITVNQIFDILDAAYEKVKADDNYRVNILLSGHDGYGRSTVVRKWFERKGIRYYQFSNPGLGALSDTDVLETLSVGQFGAILERVNFSALDPDFDAVSQIITERKFEKESMYDFCNLKFAVGTVYPKDGLNSVVELPEAFTKEFELYDVTPSLKEQLNYLISWYEKQSNNLTKLKVKSVQGGKKLEQITAFRLAGKKKVIGDILEAMGDNDFKLEAFFSPKALENVFESTVIDDVKEFTDVVVKEMSMAEKAAPDEEKQLIKNAIAKFQNIFQ